MQRRNISIGNMYSLLFVNLAIELIDCILRNILWTFVAYFLFVTFVFYPLFYIFKLKKAAYEQNSHR